MAVLMSCPLLFSRYVRVVGVFNSMNRSFHLVSFACLYTTKQSQLSEEGLISMCAQLLQYHDSLICLSFDWSKGMVHSVHTCTSSGIERLVWGSWFSPVASGTEISAPLLFVHVRRYLHLPALLSLPSTVPTENIASISASATVLEGVSRSRNALLNGNTRNYDWDSGYTCHQLGSGCIVVQLSQPYIISSMR